MFSHTGFWQLIHGLWQFLQRLWQRHHNALLLLSLGVFFPLQIFGDLAEDVWENEGGFPWDIPTLLAIRTTASPWLDTVATTVTKLGVFWGVFPMSLLLGWFLLRRHYWRSLAYMVTTLLGSIAINRTAKALLHRVRPQLWASPAPEFDYGFPSGHAMSSMSFVVVLIVLGWHTRWRWPVTTLGIAFVLVIGWSRLYLGVHYPSDIFAGWMASLAWAIGVSLILKPKRDRLRRQRQIAQLASEEQPVGSDR